MKSNYLILTAKLIDWLSYDSKILEISPLPSKLLSRKLEEEFSLHLLVHKPTAAETTRTFKAKICFHKNKSKSFKSVQS